MPDAMPPDQAGLVEHGPLVMAPRADGATIVWSVRQDCLGQVLVRPIDDDGRLMTEPITYGSDAIGMVPRSDQVLQVRIEGLEPGQTHEFCTITRAVSDGPGRGSQRVQTGPWRRFTTLDPDAPSASFVVWNDTHQQTETLQGLQRVTPEADVLVWNGDICNNWTDPDLVTGTLLAPAGLDIGAGHPVLFNWGNHDVRGDHVGRAAAAVASPEGLPYCAMRIGPVAVVLLATGEDKPDDAAPFGGRVAFTELRARQQRWLVEALARPGIADAPYRVVFTHMPLRWLDEPELGPKDYAEGAYDEVSLVSRRAWHQALTDWGAQVVVSGHTHEAAVIEADGRFGYAQVVGGGEQPDTATWIHGQADEHRLVITIHGLAGGILGRCEFEPLG